MTYTVTRQVVDAFYDAYNSGRRDQLAAMLHDDVTWLISGPVDILQFCGQRRGKEQVLELATRIMPNALGEVRITHEAVILDGNQAAVLNRMAARRHSDGRSISYRFAHFLTFKDGKVIETRSLIDTYDAAEQMLGHSLAQDDLSSRTTNMVVL